jgi:hypothetical protein
MMIGYLRSLGTVPEWILSLIEETEPTAMHYINHEEVTQLGLDSRPSLPDDGVTKLGRESRPSVPAWLQENSRRYLFPGTQRDTPPGCRMLCGGNDVLDASWQVRRL